MIQDIANKLKGGGETPTTEEDVKTVAKASSPAKDAKKLEEIASRVNGLSKADAAALSTVAGAGRAADGFRGVGWGGGRGIEGHMVEVARPRPLVTVVYGRGGVGGHACARQCGIWWPWPWQFGCEAGGHSTLTGW